MEIRLYNQKKQTRYSVVPTAHKRWINSKCLSEIILFRVYKTISDVLDTFENFLARLSATVDVDVMPGHQDFSSSFLPQQPLNSVLFPQLEGETAVNLVTNPHKFSINGGLQFLGTSGQNINDIRQFATLS